MPPQYYVAAAPVPRLNGRLPLVRNSHHFQYSSLRVSHLSVYSSPPPTQKTIMNSPTNPARGSSRWTASPPGGALVAEVSTTAPPTTRATPPTPPRRRGTRGGASVAAAGTRRRLGTSSRSTRWRCGSGTDGAAWTSRWNGSGSGPAGGSATTGTTPT